MKRIILSWSMFLAFWGSVMFSSSVMAETLNTREYWPLESGMSWTFLENGMNSVTHTVLSGDYYVNGIATKAIYQSGGEFSGLIMNYTNNETGLKRHKEFIPNLFVDSVGFVDATAVYNPPLKNANATGTLGEIINSSGEVYLTYSGLGTFPLNYNSTSKIVQFENIIISIGSIVAVKIQWSVTISGYINSRFISETVTSTIWLAQYVGPVKSINTTEGVQTISELVSINFQPYLSADFTVNQTTGFTGHPINFTDTSDGNISSWLWNFGDGSTSTIKNPTHAYSNTGDYSVSLTVSGLGNSDTETKTNFITIAVQRGDINNDGIIDLTDAILTLKLMSNIEPPVPVFKEADINNDGKIGFEEAINALQVEAGIRP